MWASNDPSSLVEGSSTICPIIQRVCPLHHGTLGGKTRSLDGALTLTKVKFTCSSCDISLNILRNDTVRLESHLYDEHDLGSSHHAICSLLRFRNKIPGRKSDARNCLANCGESNASHENMKFIRIGAHKGKLDPRCFDRYYTRDNHYHPAFTLFSLLGLSFIPFQKRFSRNE